MALLRATGLVVQALFNHLAATPPIPKFSASSTASPAPKSLESTKYHTEDWWIFRIAPAMFQLHTILAWILSALELVSAVSHLNSSGKLSSEKYTEGVTTLYVAGLSLGIAGSIIRLVCFKALGDMFTFDLTIHAKHRLITHSLYAYVRHPAYTGSLLMVFGLGITHLLCPEAILPQVLGPLPCYAIFAMWYIWLSGVGFSRVKAEDEQMHRLFGTEWEVYAEKVKWWYIPGII